MMEDQIKLYDHHKEIQLQPQNAAFYLQGEIIEAISGDNELYYLFFYKSRFLTAKKAKRVARLSYIEQAYKKGIVIQSPHPLIHSLITSNHPCQINSFQPLLRKLDTLYTPQEKAFILTFFESVIPKKQLFEELKSIYYTYRRNGQMYLGYQIVRILMNFAPKHSLVKELAHNIMFNKFANLYNEKPENLMAKDQLAAENMLFSQKDVDPYFEQLAAILEKESRWIELTALYIYKLTSIPSADHYSNLINLLQQHFTENETIDILEKLSFQIPSYLPLQKDLFKRYLQSHHIDGVFRMVNNHEFTLDSSQVQLLGDVLEQMDPETHSIQPETLQTLLKSVIHLHPEKSEQLLNKFVITLLKTNDLVYMKEWLKPLKENNEMPRIFKTIDTMHQISDDLDQMQTLGKMYYEFKQLDKALECFSWEMELEPADPHPVQWVSKIYREKGMIQESEAYRDLCVQLQKQA
ncbi:hypothetical protein [Falsibacillus pallidus]|uniref:Uncharacterized protein n=1 Tax=Falsibacillus pallidus TaxID=493781 RepID=A0A370G2H9_9BACI|nr:hypothetical protein [Falsibacillus pallidus]RDI37935.1 hypothetical protein DFR59_12033 [Falsibacillus pallidus]